MAPYAFSAALLIVYLTLGAACFAQGGRSALRWHLDVWITRPSATIKENDDGYNLTVELLLQLGSIVHHHASWQKSTKFRVLTVVESRDAVALERQRVCTYVSNVLSAWSISTLLGFGSSMCILQNWVDQKSRLIFL